MTLRVFSDARGRVRAAAPRASGRFRATLALLAGLFAATLVPAALAFEPFVVKDIRVEGVQRTDAGTVFNYLPIKVGDRVDDEKASAAVKALYATSFFRDVRLEVENGILVVIVQERPTISQIDITGTKEFDKDTLRKGLKDIGVAESRIFDRSALDRAEQEFKRQYINRGYYAMKVTTTVTPQERNRVAVNFTVEEGDVAKIAKINIVGAQAFPEATLLKEMQLSTSGWFTWYTKNDQYSKQKLSADLETLRSYYTNRGYLQFNVDSTEVSITPDKDEIYITVNLIEGPKYTVGDVRLAGELLLPEAELMRLIRVQPGDVYSREKLTQSAKAISDRLGSDGYAFANVNAVPEVDREKLTAAFTFFIDPGRRVYIRKINISGNAKTRDEVIRRELRQLEGAWYDATRIERSKVRITRLNYFDDVNVETPAVAGSPDQVDIDVTVTEKATGNLLAGVGYSSADGLVLTGSIAQNNVLGTGNSLSVSVNTSKVGRTISGSYSEPYWTADGITRTTEIYDRTIDSSSLPIAQYSSKTLGVAMGFGVPVTETDNINFGGRYEHTNLTLVPGSPLLYVDFVNTFGTSTNSYIATVGWARDTRDNVLFPNSGLLQSALLEWGLPIGDLDYYKANYLIQWFTPLPASFVWMLRGDFGYGGGLGGKPLPFFKAYYGGGVGSVRGYDTASLGPQDTQGNTIGGRRKIIGNSEVFFPLPGAKAQDQSVRLSVFADAGEIYDNGTQPQFESFRFSAGVGLAWNSPVGPLKFSYGIPLNRKPGDRVQHFQFQVGTVF
ncbi:MAG TPA: outer membrane protein assembly factor BamA [Casimicrobiaceae bacterium]|jgi:outer membrane protein insertion porin family|nr:outer membrane protein assembly factor BamA [Casimicrobiaceae bacterium]